MCELVEREIESFGRTLRIAQEGGAIGTHVWDASLVLAKYFENVDVFPPGYFAQRRVVELGCGTGVCGIVVASLGAREVFLTDLDAVLPLAQRNAETNCPGSASRVHVQRLEWGTEDVKRIPQPVDIVIMTDPLYIDDNNERLLDTLEALFGPAPSTCEALLCQEIRSNTLEVGFLRGAKARGFVLKQVPAHELDADWQSDDIVVVRISRPAASDDAAAPPSEDAGDSGTAVAAA